MKDKVISELEELAKRTSMLAALQAHKLCFVAKALDKLKGDDPHKTFANGEFIKNSLSIGKDHHDIVEGLAGLMRIIIENRDKFPINNEDVKNAIKILKEEV